MPLVFFDLIAEGAPIVDALITDLSEVLASIDHWTGALASQGLDTGEPFLRTNVHYMFSPWNDPSSSALPALVGILRHSGLNNSAVTRASSWRSTGCGVPRAVAGGGLRA
jgi:hypothetical protein